MSKMTRVNLDNMTWIEIRETLNVNFTVNVFIYKCLLYSPYN